MGVPPRNYSLTARIMVIVAMTVQLTLVARFARDFGVIPLPQLTGSSSCEAPRPGSLTRGVRRGWQEHARIDQEIYARLA